ncbi:sel1 repeat family protein [Bacillus sp. NP157]|nr:sel1 repeat family protein [Bacillus sp. NP157]
MKKAHPGGTEHAGLIPRPIDSAYTATNATDPRYAKALRIARRGGDLTDAYELLRHAAEDGDGLSIYALATWYLHGTHVPRNIRMGNQMLKVAAEKNVAAACSDLGVSYYNGWGVRKNFNLAARYYLRAFLLGDLEAAKWLEQLFFREGKDIKVRDVGREFGRFQAARGP